VTGADLYVGNGGGATLHLYGSTVYDTGNYLHLGSSQVYADGNITAAGILTVNGSTSGGVNGALCTAGHCTSSGGWQAGNISIFSGSFIQAQGLFAWSDARKKRDIVTLTPQEGLKFIDEVEPVHFYWKTDGTDAAQSHGYIAQQLVAAGYKSLVNVSPDKNMKAERTNTKEGSVESPEGAAFSANYIEAIPYLHAGLKGLVKENQDQQKEIADQQKEIDTLKADLETLKQQISK
jgi:hypothetical protein